MLKIGTTAGWGTGSEQRGMPIDVEGGGGDRGHSPGEHQQLRLGSSQGIVLNTLHDLFSSSSFAEQNIYSQYIIKYI